MVFDIGAGLSEMGKSVAQTAQAYTLESQKAELEKEKVLLADQLAGAREEKGRQHQTSERLSTQQFTGGENDKTRTNQLDVAKIGLQGHLASAGATLEAARIHAGSVEKQINAENARASVIQMNDDGTASLVNKVDGKVSPLLGEDGKPKAFRDPDMAKAQLEAVRTTSVQLGDLQRKYQTDIQGPRQSMLQAQKDPMLIGPAKEKAIAEAKAEIDRIEKMYAPDFMRLNSRLDGLAESLGTKGKLGAAGTGTRPPLSDFNRSPTPAPPAARGLIDTPIDGM